MKGSNDASAGRLYIQTFGCQMNEYDSLRVQRLLEDRGYVPTTDIDAADVIFLNTCSVRAKAEQKVHSFLGRLRRVKARRPHLKIIVAGCVAEQLGERLLERFDYLDLVLGTRAIASVPMLLEAVQANGGTRKAHLGGGDEASWTELFNRSDTLPSTVVAPVTIMQGCDNFCTYCIVPVVRGRERSRPIDEILHEVRLLVAGGAREILLLGQNVNSYGRGLPEGANFVDLLRRIQDETNVRRIRFTTSHPKDLTTELIQCFGELSKLCDHLHLPVQAGSDRILKLMNRKYTVEEYSEKVCRLREVSRSVGITADMMVGFPGETEEDFQATLRLVETLRYDNLFSFRYSDRPGTRSCDLPGKLPEDVKARRLIQLQALQAAITRSKNDAEVGTVREILVEGGSRASNGQLMGRTSQNRIVNFEGPGGLVGQLVRVKIVSALSHSLVGELVTESRC